MNFHAIGPLAARSIFEHHTHHMALAQYLYDPAYFEFMKEMVDRDNHVILDSGVYENSAIDDRQLLHWCCELKPTAVILPDCPHNVKDTLKMSLRFADMLDQAQSRVKKWKVLHAATSDELLLSYIYDSRLFDAVCFSRLTYDYGESMTGWDRRAAFVRYLQKQKVWSGKCHHHALGMRDGSLRELKELKAVGINSCDSSAPIWRGLFGCSLKHSEEIFHTPFNPFGKLGFLGSGKEDGFSLAISNFNEVLSICASR